MACATGTVTSDTAPAASSNSGNPATSAGPRKPIDGERREDAGGEIEPGDNQRAFERDAFPDVAMHVVREFVGEDHFDFLVRIRGEHRVGHQNPARRADPGQRGVGLLGLVAEAPLVRAEHARAGTLGKGEQSRAQRRFSSGFTAIEERQQQHRRELCRPTMIPANVRPAVSHHRSGDQAMSP